MADGAIIINKDGRVVAAGVTVRSLERGSTNGGKKSQAASSAALGDGKDPKKFNLSMKFSEDDCSDDLEQGGGRKATVYNGALGEQPGGKEGYTIPLRPEGAPAVSDEEFVRLAQDGHEAGVEAFLREKGNEGRVDVPKDDAVSGGIGVAGVNVCV